MNTEPWQRQESPILWGALLVFGLALVAVQFSVVTAWFMAPPPAPPPPRFEITTVTVNGRETPLSCMLAPDATMCRDVTTEWKIGPGDEVGFKFNSTLSSGQICVTTDAKGNEDERPVARFRFSEVWLAPRSMTLHNLCVTRDKRSCSECMRP